MQISFLFSFFFCIWRVYLRCMLQAMNTALCTFLKVHKHIQLSLITFPMCLSFSWGFFKIIILVFCCCCCCLGIYVYPLKANCKKKKKKKKRQRFCWMLYGLFYTFSLPLSPCGCYGVGNRIIKRRHLSEAVLKFNFTTRLHPKSRSASFRAGGPHALHWGEGVGGGKEKQETRKCEYVDVMLF